MISASQVDRAEMLLASLQDEESEEVVAVLEHGLAVLEAWTVASPRKQRKAVDGMCERVEAVVEKHDGVYGQLCRCVGHRRSRASSSVCAR